MTPAEAELTVHLARGASLAEIAAKTSRSIGTARNLLKRAFAKTDTHRQAELVCLVQRIENETGA